MRHALLRGTDVVILCGGLGTRLRGVLGDRPKPMAEIEGRPFLDILINHVAKYGMTRFILCTGYKRDFIKRYYEKKEGRLKFLISEEKKPLGTAGAIKHAELFIGSDPFLVLNGDSFCEVDIEGFHRFHLGKKAFISVAVTPIEDPKDYGVIQLDGDKKIAHFSEKKMAGGSGLINAGVYFFSRDALKEIPPGRKQSLEYDLIPKTLDKGVYGYKTDSPLLDIGTAERLEMARDYFRRVNPVRKSND
ncbi:MAG: galactokinase [Deltaproteobacteria bacterium]|nr:galactokinase [Deltaproteobacteria bacterium]